MIKNFIPNMFTFANLSFGMLSIMFAFSGNSKLAAIMILCAAFIDRYDGRIARKICAESPMGKELDSLADLVSFGAAPALLSWIVFLQGFNVIGYIIAILFPITGAFRLARYNVTEADNIFSGVPITVAGSIMAIDMLIALMYRNHILISTLLILLLSYLMVSKIKIRKI